jgi:hypothetical protein
MAQSFGLLRPPSVREGCETVGARSKLALSFSLRPWQRWSLEWGTASHDIGVSISLTRDGSDVPQILLLPERVDAHLKKQFFSWISDSQSANVLVEFDNTYSLLTAKTVTYRSCTENLPSGSVEAGEVYRIRTGGCTLRYRREDGMLVVTLPGGGTGYVHESHAVHVPSSLASSLEELSRIDRTRTLAVLAAGQAQQQEVKQTIVSAAKRGASPTLIDEATVSLWASRLAAWVPESSSVAHPARSVIASTARSVTDMAQAASSTAASLQRVADSAVSMVTRVSDSAARKFLLDSGESTPGWPWAAKQLLEQVSPWVIRRFLDMNGWECAKAASSLVTCARWRVEAKPFALSFGAVSPTLAQMPCFVAGVDHDGRPVLVLRLASNRSVVSADERSRPSEEERLKALMFAMESMASSLLGGRKTAHARSALFIVDFSGCAVSDLATSLLHRAAMLVLLRYPGMISSCWLMAAPAHVCTLWEVLRPQLPPWVARSVEMIPSSVSEDGIKALRSRLPEAVFREVIHDFPMCSSLENLTASLKPCEDGDWGDAHVGGGWGIPDEAKTVSAALEQFRTVSDAAADTVPAQAHDADVSTEATDVPADDSAAMASGDGDDHDAVLASAMEFLSSSEIPASSPSDAVEVVDWERSGSGRGVRGDDITI